MKTTTECNEGGTTVVECPEAGKMTIECGGPVTITTECLNGGSVNSEREYKTSYAKGRRQHRHPSHELVTKWVTNWRMYNKAFEVMGEEDGFNASVVGYNVYKYCAVHSQTEINDLKAQLQRSRELSKHWEETYNAALDEMTVLEEENAMLEEDNLRLSKLNEVLKNKIVELEAKIIGFEDSAVFAKKPFILTSGT
jgi:hypothetical protein